MSQLNLGFLTLTVVVIVGGVSALEWVNEARYTGEQKLHDSEKSLFMLRHGLDRTAEVAYFGMELTDEDLVSGGVTWLGLGVGDPTSGSMIGADVVTAQLQGSDDGDGLECSVVDRYVPFEQYPLMEAPMPFPIADDCEESDWIKVSCQRDTSTGVIRVEVTRPLGARDAQDREITKGLTRMIYAFGSQFQYHGGSRGAFSMHFLQDDQSEAFPPVDADEEMEYLTGDYEIPSVVTTYACSSFEVPVTKKKAQRQIVAIEPIIDERAATYVHHFVLHVCPPTRYYEDHIVTKPCEDGSPQGNPNAQCTSVVFAWAKGVNNFRLPPEAGFPVNTDEHTFILETHYDNPSLASGVRDSSGIRLHMTSKLRTHDASSVILGDPVLGFYAKGPLETDRIYHASCPSQCTETLPQPINLFASFPHMHYYGERIWTNLYEANGSFVQTINHVTNWNGGFQNTFVFDEEILLQPGQALETSCVYKTDKAEDIFIGLASDDEMCMDFLFYYPRTYAAVPENLFAFCGFFEEEGPQTICGFVPVEIPNPSKEDTEIVVDTFGKGETCKLQATASPSPTASTTPEATETPSESSSPQPTEEPVCFPGTTEVELENGSVRQMADLRIGDRVRTSSSTFSDVYVFGHARKGMFSFMNVTSDAGLSLLLSEGHFIEVNGEQLVSAGDLRIGDDLSSGRVISLERNVKAPGLYNPHTLDGMIVANGLRASTYTTAVKPSLAHLLLAPVRTCYQAFGVNILGSFCHADRSYLLKYIPFNLST